MSTKTLLGLAALAFALLCWFCIRTHGPGLWAALHPAAPAVAAPVAGAAAPNLEARLFNGKVTLTGALPDQAAKDQVIARARQQYGEGNFLDKLTVNDSLRFPHANWLPAALALLPLGNRANDEGGFALTGNSLTVRGMVESEDLKAKLLAEAKQAVAAEVAVLDNLTVRGQVNAAQLADFQAKLNELLAGRVVEFQPSRAVLTPRGKAALDQLAAVLAQTPGVPVEIGGHTDARGSETGNQRLSQRRAEACRAYLMTQGVAGQRLTSKGYGEAKPVADNQTEEGRQRNRRTEFTVLKEGK